MQNQNLCYSFLSKSPIILIYDNILTLGFLLTFEFPDSHFLPSKFRPAEPKNINIFYQKSGH